jgi:putative AbiEii toxin of type IV toxin-antitoxin system/AAA domain-containing protein
VRIASIEAHNFLSFDDLVFDQFDPLLNVIVGANGAGKSNLVRALEVIDAALVWADMSTRHGHDPLEPYERARHVHGTERGFELRVGVELNHAEQELVLGYVRTLFVSTLLTAMEAKRLQLEPGPWRADRELAAELERKVVGQLDEKEIAPLSHGKLAVGRSGHAPAELWSAGYEFAFAGKTYCWHLRGPLTDTVAIGQLRTRDEVATSSFSLFSRAWPQGEPPMARLDDLSFEMLLPASDLERISVSTEPISPQNLTLTISSLVERLGREVPQGYRLSLAEVLRHIYREGVFVLPDQRPAPVRIYPVGRIGRLPDKLEIAELPLELQRLSQGGRAERERYQATRKRFQELTGRSFELRTAELPAAAATDEDSRLIEPQVSEESAEIPLSFAGTGLWEALLLAYATTAPAEKVLVLDEPARNLHPNLQRKLLAQLLTRRGQSLVVTHSPYLVPTRGRDDLPRTVRVHKQGESSRILGLSRLDVNSKEARCRAAARDRRGRGRAGRALAAGARPRRRAQREQEHGPPRFASAARGGPARVPPRSRGHRRRNERAWRRCCPHEGAC